MRREFFPAFRVHAIVLGLCFGLGVVDTGAVTDEELFREFLFRPITPGARALGMGGAFAAVADDATAAWANPAGLTFLSRPGAFVEFRSINGDSQTLRSKRGSTDVDLLTGDRELPFIAVQSTSEPDSVSEASFLAFSWPFEFSRWGRRLTVSASRQVLSSEKRSLSSSDTARFSFDAYPNTVVGDEIQAYTVETPVSGELTTEIIYWNLAAAFEIHPDFSVGMTLTLAELNLQADSRTLVLDPGGIFLDPTHPRLPGMPLSDVYTTAIDGSDSDWTYTIGLLWHPDSVFPAGWSPWQVGVVYHEGASFQVAESTHFNQVAESSFSTQIILPDRYTIGISYRTPKHWLLSGEVERVEYSDLNESFTSGVNFLTSQRVADTGYVVAPGRDVTFALDDGNVVRVGGEYVHLLGGNSRRRLSFQAGYQRLPDASAKMAQFNACGDLDGNGGCSAGDQEVNEAFKAAFPGGSKVDVFSAGVGFTLGAYGFHLAGQTSDLGDQIVGSFSFDLNRRGNSHASGNRGTGR